jgi:hypothetical protein
MRKVAIDVNKDKWLPEQKEGGGGLSSSVTAKLKTNESCFWLSWTLSAETLAW